MNTTTIKIATLRARIAAHQAAEATKAAAKSVAQNETVREATHLGTIGAVVGGGAYAAMCVVDIAYRKIWEVL